MIILKKQEAIDSLKRGLKVSHVHFSNKFFELSKYRDTDTQICELFGTYRNNVSYESGWFLYLTEDEIKELIIFLESNLAQDIERSFIYDMRKTPALSRFFKLNLVPYLSSNTSTFVKAFINSLA